MASLPEASTTQPADVLRFWREAGRSRWFSRDDAFDAEVRRRFLRLWQRAAAGELRDWESEDDGALALTIVLDQFPRNMFRGQARAYATDAEARRVARAAIAADRDARMAADLRCFLYMPLMHSESMADQADGIRLFAALGDAEQLEYAQSHAEIIRRFGRFPHRNRALGRTTTAEEQAFLDAGGFSG